jgi:hypothetical protein
MTRDILKESDLLLYGVIAVVVSSMQNGFWFRPEAERSTKNFGNFRSSEGRSDDGDASPLLRGIRRKV